MYTNPGTIYAINKVAVENHIRLLFSYHKVPFIILRLFATYGSNTNLIHFRNCKRYDDASYKWHKVEVYKFR